MVISTTGSDMVWMTTMAECQRGNHQKCPGGVAAPPGEFGGVICECFCHSPNLKPGAQRQELRQEVELAFWRSIKDGNDPEDFALYLKVFPDGIFMSLAKARLASLNGSSPTG